MHGFGEGPTEKEQQCHLAGGLLYSINDGRSLGRAFISLLKDPMLLPVYIFILSYLAVISGNASNGRKV